MEQERILCQGERVTILLAAVKVEQEKMAVEKAKQERMANKEKVSAAVTTRASRRDTASLKGFSAH